MATPLHLSAEFLADLETVCPRANYGELSSSFLKDLEYVHAHVAQRYPLISTADLASLGIVFDAWRSHYQRMLHEHLEKLPHDDPLICPISLFGTMDYGRLEIAHTRALAWLLADKEHGFEFKLLDALLLHVLNATSVDTSKYRLTQVDCVKSEYAIDCGPAATDIGRIDILAKGRWEKLGKETSWLLVIEAKIDADEGEEQLRRYDEWIIGQEAECEVIRVFLTRDGREPLSSGEAWYPLSFIDLASTFRRVSHLQKRPGYHFLRYYLSGLLRDICKLPIPISADCPNPYVAVDYLQSVVGTGGSENGDGEPR
jgi:hypothetical protein